MTQRLLHLLLSHWDEVNGFAVSQNMPDLREMYLDRLTWFLYWYFTRNGDPDSIATFRAKLWIPPKGMAIPAQSPWSAENERASFSAFASQFSGMAKS